MVSNDVVRKSNALIPSALPRNYTAVFIGATSGIGYNFLEQFNAVAAQKSPHIYIVGRSAAAAVEQIAILRQRNESAEIEFIEADISLVKEVDRVVDVVKSKETKVDLLYASPGFIPFDGRKETPEGLDPSMTTRYYSRLRAVQKLLPLLQASSQPRVVNVGAGGQEGALNESDLDLRKPGNFGPATSSVHSATMLTLALDHLAKENPKITFIHTMPGLVATPILTRGSSGVIGFLLRWVVVPFLNTFFATKPEDAGARVLFFSTSTRYTVPESADGAVPIPDGLQVLERRAGLSVFLVGADGEATGNEKLLNDLKQRVEKKVWDHTEAIFTGLH